MARTSKSQQIIDLLAEEQLEIDDTYAAPERTEAPEAVEWSPPMGKTGEQIFHCEKKFVLAHGERGSGKTFAVLHKIVKHLYDNDGAMACITVVTRSSAILGGAWTKFQKVLHIWQDGLGLEGEGKKGEFMFKMDDGRNRYVWIKNCHGGWSMAFLKSLQHAEHIKERVKGMEFSIFFFDELTETDDERYFTDTIQQLGRLPGISPQQFIGACNPSDEGEDHWVHKRFFQGFDDPNDAVPKRSIDYAVYHVPMSENSFMDRRDDYVRTVMEACRNDPTAYDRLILGKWVKRPTGKGLFAPYFSRALHVRGDMAKRTFIIPRGSSIDIGYDIGSANTSITFEERIYTKQGELYSWFDEIVLVEKYIPIPQVAPMLLNRMNYWCGRTGRKLHFNHIADSASFDQMRPDGSYDARKLEQEVAKEVKEHPERYPHLQHLIYDEEKNFRLHPIRLRACEKPPGSRSARVRMTISRLQANLLVLSARCTRHIEMLEQLEQDPDKPYEPKKNTRFGHPFDSGTYPIFHYEMGGRTAGPNVESDAKLVELRP
jgi:PBSX family phage terminase large subunit